MPTCNGLKSLCLDGCSLLVELRQSSEQSGRASSTCTACGVFFFFCFVLSLQTQLFLCGLAFRSHTQTDYYVTGATGKLLPGRRFSENSALPVKCTWETGVFFMFDVIFCLRQLFVRLYLLNQQQINGRQNQQRCWFEPLCLAYAYSHHFA